MSEYIKREAVIDRLKRNLDACNPDTFSELCYRDAIETVKWFPAAEVAPVVHCWECEHSYEAVGGRFCTYGVCVDCEVPDDFYCGNGKRGETGEG
jgi:hypothetical protein